MKFQNNVNQILNCKFYKYIFIDDKHNKLIRELLIFNLLYFNNIFCLKSNQQQMQENN